MPKIFLGCVIPVLDDMYRKIAIWLNDMGKKKDFVFSFISWKKEILLYAKKIKIGSQVIQI